MRAVPTRVGQHRRGRVVEHIPAHVGQRLGLPLPGAAVVLGGQRRGMGVDHRGDRIEHRGVVEPALHLPPAVGEPGQEQLVHPGRGPVVGLLTVLIQQLDQRRAPLLQLVRGVLVGLAGQLRLRTRPGVRREPPGRPARQHPGDHLDVPQPRAPRREHLRRRRQPGRHHGSVQPRARRDLLGSRHPAAGLEPLPAQQIAQRLNRRPVTPLGEHPVAVQPGNRGHGDLVQLPRRRLTQRQNRHPLTRRARLRHPTQRIHRLHKQALRGSERALGHAYIFASTTDNSGASATIPSKIFREVRATTSLASCRTRQTNNARFHPPEPGRRTAAASVTTAPPRRPRRTRPTGRRPAGSPAGGRSPRPVPGYGRRGSRSGRSRRSRGRRR